MIVKELIDIKYVLNSSKRQNYIYLSIISLYFCLAAIKGNKINSVLLNSTRHYGYYTDR